MIGNESGAKSHGKDISQKGTSVSYTFSEYVPNIITPLGRADNTTDSETLPTGNNTYQKPANDWHDSETKLCDKEDKLKNIVVDFTLQLKKKGPLYFSGEEGLSKAELLKWYQQRFLPTVLVDRCDAILSGNDYFKSKCAIVPNEKAEHCMVNNLGSWSNTDPNAQTKHPIYTQDLWNRPDQTDINSNLDCKEGLRYHPPQENLLPLPSAGLSGDSYFAIQSSTDIIYPDEPSGISGDNLKKLVQDNLIDGNVSRRRYQKLESDDDRFSDNFEKQGQEGIVADFRDHLNSSSLCSLKTPVRTLAGRAVPTDAIVHPKDKGITEPDTHQIEHLADKCDKQNKKRKPRRKLYTARRRTKWLKGLHRKSVQNKKRIGTGHKTREGECEIYDFTEDPSDTQNQIEICRKGTLNSNGNLFQARARKGNPDLKTLKLHKVRTVQSVEKVQIKDPSNKLKVPKLRIKKKLVLPRYAEGGCDLQYVSTITEDVDKVHSKKRRRKRSTPHQSVSSVEGIHNLTSKDKNKHSSSYSPAMAQVMSDHSARLASEFKNHNWLESKILGGAKEINIQDKTNGVPEAVTQAVESMVSRTTGHCTGTGNESCPPASVDNQSSGMVISTQHPSLRKEANNEQRKKRRKVRKASDTSAPVEACHRMGPPTTPPNQIVPNSGGKAMHPTFSSGTSNAISIPSATRQIRPLPPPFVLKPTQPDVQLIPQTDLMQTVQSHVPSYFPTIVQPAQMTTIVPQAASWTTSQAGPVTYLTLVPGQPRPQGQQMQVMLIGQPNSIPASPLVPSQANITPVTTAQPREQTDVVEARATKLVLKPSENKTSSEPPGLLSIPKEISSADLPINSSSKVPPRVALSDNVKVTTTAVQNMAESECKKVEQAANNTDEEVVEIYSSKGTEKKRPRLPDIVPGDHDLPQDLLAIKREFEKQKKELEMLFELSRQKEREKVMIGQKTRDTYIKMKDIGQKVKQHYEHELHKGADKHRKEICLPPEEEHVDREGKEVKVLNASIPVSSPKHKSAEETSSTLPKSAYQVSKTAGTCTQQTTVVTTVHRDTVITTNSSTSDQTTATSVLPQARLGIPSAEKATPHDRVVHPTEETAHRQISQPSKEEVNFQPTRNPQLPTDCHEENKQSRRKSIPHKTITSIGESGTMKDNQVAFNKNKCPIPKCQSPSDGRPLHTKQGNGPGPRTNKNIGEKTTENVIYVPADVITLSPDPPTAAKSLYELEKLSNGKSEPVCENNPISFEVALHQGKIHPAFPFNEQRQLGPMQRSLTKSNLSDTEKKRRQIALFQMQEQQRMLFGRLAAMDPASRKQFVQQNAMLTNSQVPQGATQVGSTTPVHLSESDRDRHQHTQVKYAMEVALLQQRMRQIEMELNEVSGKKIIKGRKRKGTQDQDESDQTAMPAKCPKTSSPVQAQSKDNMASSAVECKDGSIASSPPETYHYSSSKQQGQAQSSFVANQHVVGLPNTQYLRSDNQNIQKGYGTTIAEQARQSYPGAVTSMQPFHSQGVPSGNGGQGSVISPQYHAPQRAGEMHQQLQPVFNQQAGGPPHHSSSGTQMSTPYYHSERPNIQTSLTHRPQNPYTTSNPRFYPPNVNPASAPHQGATQPRPHVQMAAANGMIRMPNGQIMARPMQAQQANAAIGQSTRTDQRVPPNFNAQNQFQIQQQMRYKMQLAMQQQQQAAQGYTKSDARATRPVVPEMVTRQQNAIPALCPSFHQQPLPIPNRTHQESLSHGERKVQQNMNCGAPSVGGQAPFLSADCYTCRKPAQFLCSGCKKVAYCTIQCQAMSWKTHCWQCNIPEPALLN